MIYNCHVHTLHSHDSKAIPEEICQSAIRCKINGVAITDHCDCEFAVQDHVYDRISSSVHDAKQAQKFFSSDLTVMSGVELGDALFDPEFAQKMIVSFPYDVILGSVHAVRSEKNDRPFSLIDFTHWTQDEINIYLKQYFTDILVMLKNFDFDVLSHLTVPLRYICGKYEKTVDLSLFHTQIEQIFHRVIEQGQTLEINTQNAKHNFEGMHPPRDLVGLYKTLGGNTVSIGSDAHTPETIDNGLDTGIRFLKECGFHEACYFQNRIIVPYKL